MGYVYVTHICKGDHKKLSGGLENGREANLMSDCAAEVWGHFETKKAKGFNFKFGDKFHPYSRAYYCRLTDLQEPWGSF